MYKDYVVFTPISQNFNAFYTSVWLLSSLIIESIFFAHYHQQNN